jgi:hypothetical protein
MGKRAAAIVSSGREALFLSLYFANPYDLCIGAEFLVIAKGLLLGHIEVFQQSEPHADLEVNLAREPDFIVDSRLLNHEA